MPKDSEGVMTAGIVYVDSEDYTDLTDKVFDDTKASHTYMKKKPEPHSETRRKADFKKAGEAIAKKRGIGVQKDAKLPNKDVFEKMLSNEYVVNVPPKESNSVTVKINKIIEDKPKFVEHEIWELLDDDDE